MCKIFHRQFNETLVLIKIIILLKLTVLASVSSEQNRYIYMDTFREAAL